MAQNMLMLKLPGSWKMKCNYLLYQSLYNENYGGFRNHSTLLQLGGNILQCTWVDFEPVQCNAHLPSTLASESNSGLDLTTTFLKRY